MHWSTKWLGRPFIPGQYDCLDFVREVLREEFGREIRIPPRVSDTMRTMVREIEELAGDVAVAIDMPREGDAVLLKPAGTRLTGSHIGVYCEPQGQPHVLHCVETLGSVLYGVGVIGEHGWEIEGYYEWR